jgi:dTDP-4-dehydrorhamnose 3,5-epimerase
LACLRADRRKSLCGLYSGGNRARLSTLADDTELLYAISAYYEPAAARGLRWNDSALAIAWPILPPTVISQKDQQLPLLAL